MKEGFTTGTCATAGAFLAATRLLGADHQSSVPIKLPDGQHADIPIHSSGIHHDTAWVRVQKFSGDDPDITHEAFLFVEVKQKEEPGIQFRAGEGVGIVTKAGLLIPPGEPAINPVPRQMISDHLLALSPGWDVCISIEGGEELAAKTFNPRLGIQGGLSVLGTTGRVRPFSHHSQLCSIKCAIGVAKAHPLERLVLVPGHYGERAARKHFQHIQDPGIIEVGNDWGFALDCLHDFPELSILVVGHPSKLAKLALQQWDTHSSKSKSAISWLCKIWSTYSQEASQKWDTVEGFAESIAKHALQTSFWNHVAEQVQNVIHSRIPHATKVEVALCNMHGKLQGMTPGTEAWK